MSNFYYVGTGTGAMVPVKPTKQFILCDEENNPISTHFSLADAQEMLIDLAFEDMYEDFLWSIYEEGFCPQEWFNMMWQNVLMYCAMFKNGVDPFTKSVWAFLDDYTCYYSIRENIPMFFK